MVNVEELMISKDKLMIIFFQPVLACLQFHKIDNSKQCLCFSLPRCDFASIAYALNAIS